MRGPLREVKKDESISHMRGNAASKTAQPRQKRAIETRAGLLAAVERIVAAEGAAAVTTTRVASETGAAVGTIYRYFADRDEMLLAAYDATVGHLIETCHAALEELPDTAPVEKTARHLLGVYLAEAEAIPAHAGLLAAMRSLRPIAVERSFHQDRVITELIAPFFARFTPAAKTDRLRLHLMSSVLGTLVDLYLVTPGRADRAMLREEIEAHLVLMVARTMR